jgi:hypothetical protein
MLKLCIVLISLVLVHALTPHQVHLVYDPQVQDASSVLAIWVTKSDGPSVVQVVTPNQSKLVYKGYSYDYPNYAYYLHRVALTNLTTSGLYTYRVGSDSAWSGWFTFQHVLPDQALSIAIFGDMGTTDAADTVTQLLTARASELHGAMLLGDLAYADGDAALWDAWYELVTPFATRGMLQSTLGNHENESCCGYTQYMARQALGTQYWRAWQWGAAVFFAVSSEHSLAPGSAQYTWLERELARWSRASSQPWLIVTMHRALYCTLKHWCNSDDQLSMRRNIEPLLRKYGVAVVFAGHVHAYERTVAVYNNQADSAGTVHITVGTAGAKLNDKWMDQPYSWSASSMSHHGYGLLQITSDALSFQLYRSKNNAVADQVTLTRQRK